MYQNTFPLHVLKKLWHSCLPGLVRLVLMSIKSVAKNKNNVKVKNCKTSWEFSLKLFCFLACVLIPGASFRTPRILFVLGCSEPRLRLKLTLSHCACPL